MSAITHEALSTQTHRFCRSASSTTNTSNAAPTIKPVVSAAGRETLMRRRTKLRKGTMKAGIQAEYRSVVDRSFPLGRFERSGIILVGTARLAVLVVQNKPIGRRRPTQGFGWHNPQHRSTFP